MNEGGEKPVTTNADKAREAAKLGQKLKRLGFTHTQASNASAHELKHGLADKGGEGSFWLRQDGSLTVPTYSAHGERTAAQKKKIALAPGSKASQTDLKIASQAEQEMINEEGFFRKIIRRIFKI